MPGKLTHRMTHIMEFEYKQRGLYISDYLQLNDDVVVHADGRRRDWGEINYIVVEVPAEVAYGIAQFIDPSDELQAMHNKEFICVNSGKECHSRRVFVSRHDSSYFLTTVWPGRLTDTIIR